MTTQNHHLLRDTATCSGDATGAAFDGARACTPPHRPFFYFWHPHHLASPS